MPLFLGGHMLSFEEVKKIRMVDVVGRYGIRLRFKGEWATAPCPLPSHTAGDKGRNFTINLGHNYWRCFSASCNQKNEGRRGGDVINFVALMENCRERDAAQKLATWYGLTENKTAPLLKRGRRSPKYRHLARTLQIIPSRAIAARGTSNLWIAGSTNSLNCRKR